MQSSSTSRKGTHARPRRLRPHLSMIEARIALRRSFGLVSKVCHLQTGRIYALKEFREPGGVDETVEKTATREVKMLKVSLLRGPPSHARRPLMRRLPRARARATLAMVSRRCAAIRCCSSPPRPVLRPRSRAGAEAPQHC